MPHLTTEVVTTAKQRVKKADITIVSYALIGKAKISKPKTIVCDEAHYLQSRSAQRTKAITEASAGLRLWLLTGTPLWSRPRSLFPLLNLVGGWDHTYFDFTRQFCNAGYVMKPIRGKGMTRIWDDSGSSNLDELADVLRPHMMRRLKMDVLTELPAKTRQVIFCNNRISDEEKAVGKFDFSSMKDGSIPPGPIATAIQETAMWKMKSINDHIETVLSSENKIIVFAWNRKVMEQIERANIRYGVVRIDGSTPATDRGQIIDEFQNGSPRIFLGQTVAAGTGLTLTAASVVIFAQPSWTPAELEQAEDRAHRIGQKDNVTIHYLVTKGSIEQAMLKGVLSKMITSKKILD